MRRNFELKESKFKIKSNDFENIIKKFLCSKYLGFICATHPFLVFQKEKLIEILRDKEEKEKMLSFLFSMADYEISYDKNGDVTEIKLALICDGIDDVEFFSVFAEYVEKDSYLLYQNDFAVWKIKFDGYTVEKEIIQSDVSVQEGKPMKSFITDKKLLKNGGRKGFIISPEELEEKIYKLGESYGAKETEYNSLLYSSMFQILCQDKQIKSDLSKITFDFENLDVDDSVYEDAGFHTLDNGFSFLLCIAGGDWECAIGFIIYWDGKKLRGYIPTLGNTFNLKKKCAFGSEDDGDDVVDGFSDFVYEITGRTATSQELDSVECGEYYIDLDLFKEDIMSRIEIDAEEIENYKKSLEEKEEKPKQTFKEKEDEIEFYKNSLSSLIDAVLERLEDCDKDKIWIFSKSGISSETFLSLGYDTIAGQIEDN